MWRLEGGQEEVGLQGCLVQGIGCAAGGGRLPLQGQGRLPPVSLRAARPECPEDLRHGAPCIGWFEMRKIALKTEKFFVVRKGNLQLQMQKSSTS